MKNLILLIALIAFSLSSFSQNNPDGKNWKHTGTNWFTKALNIMGATLDKLSIDRWNKNATDTIPGRAILIYKADSTGNAPGNYMTRQNVLEDPAPTTIAKAMNNWTGTDYVYGLLGSGMGSTTTMSDAVLKGSVIYIPTRKTVTGVKYSLATAGTSVFDAYNGVGLYSISGTTYTKIAESTTDALIWTLTANVNTKAFATPVVCDPGYYYVTYLNNNSTVNTAAVINTDGVLGAVINGMGANFACWTLAGQASNPASITKASVTISSSYGGLILY